MCQSWGGPPPELQAWRGSAIPSHRNESTEICHGTWISRSVGAFVAFRGEVPTVAVDSLLLFVVGGSDLTQAIVLFHCRLLPSGAVNIVVSFPAEVFDSSALLDQLPLFSNFGCGCLWILEAPSCRS